jgi:hypothetical protein
MLRTEGIYRLPSVIVCVAGGAISVRRAWPLGDLHARGVWKKPYSSDAANGRDPDGSMAHLPRVIAVDGSHHVTQRGNARRFILDGDTDRSVYLDLLSGVFRCTPWR